MVQCAQNRSVDIKRSTRSVTSEGRFTLSRVSQRSPEIDRDSKLVQAWSVEDR
jgi:hypothetical protein